MPPLDIFHTRRAEIVCIIAEKVTWQLETCRNRHEVVMLEDCSVTEDEIAEVVEAMVIIDDYEIARSFEGKLGIMSIDLIIAYICRVCHQGGKHEHD